MSRKETEITQPSKSLTGRSSEDTGSTYYPTKPSGPSENVKAVWAVLKENWPNAFKSVDGRDPSGVWASNLNDLTSSEMIRGLQALRRTPDRYMPNAPNVRRLFKAASANMDAPQNEPVDERSEIDITFDRLMNRVFMRYAKIMILQKHEDFGERQASLLYEKSVLILKPYKEAWRTEANRGPDTWLAVAKTATNALLREWNAVMKPFAPIEDYDALFRER